MLNKIIYKVIIILFSVFLLAKLYSYLVIAKSERFKTRYMIIENFYNNLSRKNDICSKPFKPTCNRDKIFLSLRSLEDKIDELEYKLYRKHRDKQKDELHAEGKKRAQNIKNMVAKDTREANRDRIRRERKARALENKRTIIRARNQQERAQLLNSIQNDPGVRNPPKLPSFSSQSKSSPILNEARGGVRKGRAKIDSELSGKKNKSKRDSVKGDIKDAQSKIDAPSEFVL